MIGKRLTVLATCAGLMGIFGGAPEAWSKKSPPTMCPGGRFLVSGNGQLVQGGSVVTPDSVTINGGVISVGSGCPGMTGHIKAKKHFTKVTAKGSCGSAGTGHLNAKITSPDCGAMAGTFKTKGAKAKQFTATRSICGDNIVDAGNGEECEPAVGGCPANMTCTAACKCEPQLGVPTTTTATTLEPTTTTVSTTTSTTGFTCGGLRRLCSGTCPAGQTCVSSFVLTTTLITLPTITIPIPTCECRITCAASSPTCGGVCPAGQECGPILIFPGIQGAGQAIIRPLPCGCHDITTTTVTTTTIVTTTTTIPCHSNGVTCGGSCPAGQACIGAPTIGIGCHCIGL